MRKTAKYYKSNPEAAAKKREYQKKYNKRPDQVKKRVELNRENRRRGGYGDGYDMSHTKDGRIVKEKASTNRARNRGKK